MSEGQRVFLRRRSWVFWVYLIAFVVGALLWPAVFSSAVALRFWVMAIIWVLVLGALLALLLKRLNLFGGDRPALLAAALLWGSVPAAAFALRLNSALLAEFDRYLAGYQAWDAAAVAPVVEESLKAAGIVAVVVIGRKHVVRAAHGAVIGAMCGLGFQLVEDVNYVLDAAAGQLSSTAESGALSSDAGVTMTIVIRTVTAPNSHWLFSALVGLGVGYAVVRRERPVARRAVVAAGAFMTAVAMHFVADSPEPANSLAFALTVCKVLVAVLMGYVLYRFAMRAEWRRFAAVANAEPGDVIAATDVAATRSRREREQAQKRVRVESGRAAGRRARRLQRAQLLLVNEIIRDGDAPRRRAEVRALRASTHPSSVAAGGSG